MDAIGTVGVGRKSAKKFLCVGSFTLVELLVVIGIIAVIAAILLPVVSHAREGGRRTTCQSNQRQIGVAMQQYVQDYEGVYPNEMFAYKTGGVTTEVSWREVLFPYAKSREILRCPSQGKAVPTVGIPADGYTLNDERVNIFRWSRTNPRTSILTVQGRHESYLVNSATIWLSGDRIAVENFHCVDCTRGTGSCGRNFYGSTVHNQGGNYLFLDGHVNGIPRTPWRKWTARTIPCLRKNDCKPEGELTSGDVRISIVEYSLIAY